MSVIQHLFSAIRFMVLWKQIIAVASHDSLIVAVLLIRGYAMGCEIHKELPGLDDKASQIFLDFMNRSTKFEELVAIGSQLLSRFHQELELFRRPPVHEVSNVMKSIVEANCTERMIAYVEAGCMHGHDGVQNISKLNACQQGLHDYIAKAKVLLDELEGLTEEAMALVQKANEILANFVDTLSIDNTIDPRASFEMEESKFSHRRALEVSDYTAMMRTISSMVKLDYTMQEKIVSSLNLKSSSEELESYCLMWDLRPFINDDIMHRAWRFI